MQAAGAGSNMGTRNLDQERDGGSGTPSNPGPKGIVSFLDGNVRLKVNSSSTFQVTLLLQNVLTSTLSDYQVHVWVTDTPATLLLFAMPTGFSAVSGSSPYSELLIQPTGGGSLTAGAAVDIPVVATPQTTGSLTLNAALLSSTGTSIQSFSTTVDLV